MSWLLDTNILSDLRKGERADPALREWIARVPDDQMFTSVLVVGELRRGVESIRRRDRVAAAALEQWLAHLVESYVDRIVGIDTVVADVWGRLNVPDPIPTVDGLLAATAIVHDLTLVTRNTRDVSRTSARVLDPTAPA